MADVGAALAHHTLGVPDVVEAHDPAEHALHALLSQSRASLTGRLEETTIADLLGSQ